MATIDPTVIKKLVETQLLTVDALVIPAAGIFVAGDPEPDGLTRWIRLVAIDIHDQERPRAGAASDEPDHADVVVAINCCASAQRMRENRGALSCIMAEVKRVMGQATLLDAPTTHQLDLVSCRTAPDRDVDDLRLAATGAVICEGVATRLSGTSMLQFGTA